MYRDTHFVRGAVKVLRADLFYALSRACLEEIDHSRWDTMNCLDRDSWSGIYNAVTEPFETTSRWWHKYPSVLQELESVSEIIKDALEIGLTVPRPSDVDVHIHHVIANIESVFDRRWGPRLERSMNAVIIQDAWRECYYDPTHPMCRDRLARDFEILAADLEKTHP